MYQSTVLLSIIDAYGLLYYKVRSANTEWLIEMNMLHLISWILKLFFSEIQFRYKTCYTSSKLCDIFQMSLHIIDKDQDPGMLCTILCILIG